MNEWNGKCCQIVRETLSDAKTKCQLHKREYYIDVESAKCVDGLCCNSTSLCSPFRFTVPLQ